MILGTDDGTVSLVPEERIMLALNANSLSIMTVNKIKRLYNKADGKSVAAQLSSAAQENSCPVRVAHNSAGHLAGTARSLGGVLIGECG